MDHGSWLSERGMRPTVFRLRVLRVLFERQTPLSHTEILESLIASGGESDRVTLYRTLAAFAEAGLLHQIQGVDGTLRFRLHDPLLPGCPGGHPHFLCRTCGRMICLEGQLLPFVEVPQGALVEGKQMLIFGRCPDCRSDEETCRSAEGFDSQKEN